MSSLPGVTVTCEPKDFDVSLQVPLNSEGDNRYSWSLQLSYEVRLKSGLVRTEQVKRVLIVLYCCAESWITVFASLLALIYPFKVTSHSTQYSPDDIRHTCVYNQPFKLL